MKHTVFLYIIIMLFFSCKSDEELKNEVIEKSLQKVLAKYTFLQHDNGKLIDFYQKDIFFSFDSTEVQVRSYTGGYTNYLITFYRNDSAYSFPMLDNRYRDFWQFDLELDTIQYQNPNNFRSEFYNTYISAFKHVPYSGNYAFLLKKMLYCYDIQNPNYFLYVQVHSERRKMIESDSICELRKKILDDYINDKMNKEIGRMDVKIMLDNANQRIFILSNDNKTCKNPEFKIVRTDCIIPPWDERDIVDN